MTARATKTGVLVEVAFTHAEFELVLEIMRRCGHATPASTINAALWNLARHLDLDPSIDDFPDRSGGRARRRKIPGR